VARKNNMTEDLEEQKPRRKRGNSRWKKGGKRYDEKTLEVISRTYDESPGWFKGARVYKK
jgi:hypothetical protein